jgi:hypothetical protein
MDDQWKISLPSDFEEDINKTILLTGAGFTKNFGGLLACEVWQYIFNHPDTSYSIKNVMRNNERNYEYVYGSLLGEDIEKYLDILREQFILIDNNILSRNRFKELKKFMDLFYDSHRYNFIFTTNQDLLIERYFLAHTANREAKPGEQSSINQVADDVPLNFPYLNFDLTEIARSTTNQCVQSSQKDHYPFNKFKKAIAYEKNKLPIKGKMNYVKLHGSFNWDHSEGFIVNITGTEKTTDILKTNIFKMGFSLLDYILKVKVNIVIVGYGFNDAHINDRLLMAAQNKSSLVIVSPDSWCNLQKRQLLFSNDAFKKDSKTYTRVLLDSVDKYYECSFDSFFDLSRPTNQWNFDNLEAYLLRNI